MSLISDKERHEADAFFERHFTHLIEEREDLSPAALQKNALIGISLRADPTVYLWDPKARWQGPAVEERELLADGIRPEHEGRVANLEAYLRETEDLPNVARYVVPLREFPGYMAVHVARPTIEAEEAGAMLLRHYVRNPHNCGIEGVVQEIHPAFVAHYGKGAVENHYSDKLGVWVVGRRDVAAALTFLDDRINEDQWLHCLTSFDERYRPRATVLQSSLPDPLTAYPVNLLKHDAITQSKHVGYGALDVDTLRLGESIAFATARNPTMNDEVRNALENARETLRSAPIITSRVSERRFVERLSHDGTVIANARDTVLSSIKSLQTRSGIQFYPMASSAKALEAHGYQAVACALERNSPNYLGYPTSPAPRANATIEHALQMDASVGGFMRVGNVRMIDVDRAAAIVALEIGSEGAHSTDDLPAMLYSAVRDATREEFTVLLSFERNCSYLEAAHSVRDRLEQGREKQLAMHNEPNERTVEF